MADESTAPRQRETEYESDEELWGRRRLYDLMSESELRIANGTPDELPDLESSEDAVARRLGVRGLEDLSRKDPRTGKTRPLTAVEIAARFPAARLVFIDAEGNVLKDANGDVLRESIADFARRLENGFGRNVDEDEHRYRERIYARIASDVPSDM
jgi:hypothetical protein